MVASGCSGLIAFTICLVRGWGGVLLKVNWKWRYSGRLYAAPSPPFPPTHGFRKAPQMLGD